jgi:hypothetical protein
MIDQNVPTADKIISCPHSIFSSLDNFHESDLASVHFNEILILKEDLQPPASLMTQVAIEWNEHSLFVFFRGRFEQLQYLKNPGKEILERKTANLTNVADVYGVCIGPKARTIQAYKEFQIAPDGRWFDNDIHVGLGVSNPNWYSGCKFKSFIDTEMNIWSSVMELSWQSFHSSYDSVPDWNVNFYRIIRVDEDKVELLWSPVGLDKNSFHIPDKFGRIQFEYE